MAEKNWVSGVIILHIGVVTSFIACRGPPCSLRLAPMIAVGCYLLNGGTFLAFFGGWESYKTHMRRMGLEYLPA